jgi:hypothetical protein
VVDLEFDLAEDSPAAHDLAETAPDCVWRRWRLGVMVDNKEQNPERLVIK